MAKRSRKAQKTSANVQEFVVVTLACNNEEAKDYEAMLQANDIPVAIEEQYGPTGDTDGIGILIPEEFLGQAQVIIESQEAYEDFYDSSLEDDEFEDDYDDDFNDNYLDDEF